ncbi:Berberine/berberine-like protein [Macrophomina phaseolina MS6]|uniref:Berberine/berberine-like protein n=1 Tax=Macrophomina phaseolina (strain MS6) TaxID=1126212 RepID=K2S258_MACPH|nr:Berberine/berberine-like protein [Macrophomina phaseolina MS6]
MPYEEDKGRQNFEYVNYDGADSGPEKGYGTNYARLKELKAKYDPPNVFKKNIATGLAGDILASLAVQYALPTSSIAAITAVEPVLMSMQEIDLRTSLC